MKPRILLINPWIHDFAAYNLWARPLGLHKVAEFLSAFDAELLLIDCTNSFEWNKHGVGKYRSEIIQKPDLLRGVPRYYKRYGMSVNEFRLRLKSLLPIDIVLMTGVMTYWYPGVQEAIWHVRDVSGKVPVVIGGIYPTLYPDHALKNTGASGIHMGRVDEGLIRIFHDFGIVIDRRRGPVSHHTLGFHADQAFAPLLTSSGCPFHCSYCASNLLYPVYEKRSATDILNEIRRLAALGVSDFAFYDDALLYRSSEHIKPLLEGIIRSGLCVRLHAPNGLHARFIDPDLAYLMRESGFATIRLGLETVDSSRQGKTGGKVANADFERAVIHLKRAGFTRVQIGAYLLYRIA